MQSPHITLMKTTIARSVIVIVFLSFTSACLALFAINASFTDAKQLSTTDSLKLQSYRLALDIETDSPLLNQHIKKFEEALFSPSMTDLRHWSSSKNNKEDYLALIRAWENLPLSSGQVDRKTYVAQINSFITKIDNFALGLKQSSENKLDLVILIAVIKLVIILFLIFFTIHYSQRHIVTPLNDLMAACLQIKRHNFDLTLKEPKNNALGILSQTLTSMAKELEHLHQELRQDVPENNNLLHHAHESLKILYSCSQQLSVSRLTNANFSEILETFIANDGLIGAKLIFEEQNGNATEICVGVQEGDAWHFNNLHIDGERMGQLWWQYTLPYPDQTLINNISDILARGVYFYRTQKRTEQLLLMEERTIIARELHDSLAQSLSYLKIQLTLLKRQLASPKTQIIDQQQTVEAIDEGLSSAYTQLRELLNTFRLTINETDFDEALNKMLEVLEDQTDSKLITNNQLASMSLVAHDQIHLLQIIREAVLNAIKHASANQIIVNCNQYNNTVNVTIADDGVGFDLNNQKLNHYGLTIMSERASRLGGSLDIQSQLGAGSTVNLNFPL